MTATQEWPFAVSGDAVERSGAEKRVTMPERAYDATGARYGVKSGQPRRCVNTSRGLTPTDRRNRSEGCRAGYPRPCPDDTGFRVVTRTRRVRRQCPTVVRRALLARQDFLCAYCAVPFGSVVRKRGRLILTAVQFDHMVPLAWTQTNPDDNWAAACNICNQLKGALLFRTIADLVTYLEVTKELRGISVTWWAPVSSEKDPHGWAVKFGSYLAGLPPRLAGSLQWKSPPRRTRRADASKFVIREDER